MADSWIESRVARALQRSSRAMTTIEGIGVMPVGDLSLLVGVDKLPHSALADAYRRSTTPTQTAEQLR